MRQESSVPIGSDPERIKCEIGKGLRFSSEVEKIFADNLRQSQQKPARVLAFVGVAIFTLFAIIDFRRYGISGNADYHATLFAFGVILPRVACLVLLLGVAVAVQRVKTAGHMSLLVMAVHFLIGFTIFATTVTYSHLALPYAISSYVVIVAAVFLPCGLLFREAAAIGAMWCVVAVLLAFMVLNIPTIEEKLLFAIIVVISYLTSCISAYMRELAQREQFLLRKLVDWDAEHDFLTGLLNRRSFFQTGPQRIQQAHIDKASLFMVIVDVDHFKEYNDHHGHAAGDLALVKVAQCLQSMTLKSDDLLVRLGGEEFGILLEHTDATEVARSVRRCQDLLTQDNTAHGTSPMGGCLTFSAGVAELREPDTLGDLYWRADVSLYLAKQRGRNLVVVEPGREIMDEDPADKSGAPALCS